MTSPSRLGRIRPLPRYLSIAKLSVQDAIAYRVTTIIGIAVAFIWVFILYFLWKAAYANTGVLAGYTWDQMRTYIVVAFGINSMVGWRVASMMMATVKTGDVIIEYVRPLNYCLTQISRACGYCVVEGLVSLVASLVVGFAILDITAPASALSAVVFALSVVLGVLTKALFVFLVSLITFWTLSGLGLMWTQQAVVQVFSGAIVPLSLMPGWLQSIASFLPLRGIASTPLTLYLGKAGLWGAVGLVGTQLGWLVVLFILANLAWRRAFNTAEIQGG